jgi:chromatin remodeling complex protein RSC6|tara:strand:+ start:1155 stop:1757 length:603 start_codon:yes stop_codon:yes gene_type:complete
MVRTTKSTEKPASASTPKPRVKKASKEVAAPVVETAPVEPVNEIKVAEATDISPIVTKMSEFSAKLQQIGSLFATVKNDYKTLEKVVNRELKQAQKASSKKKRNNANRRPSGFVKPARISDELATFLKKDIGTEMARTDVSKEINAYIQANDLKDKKNGRIIHPDAKLTKLLKIGKEDELTYFNLQRYLKHHFAKSTPSA